MNILVNVKSVGRRRPAIEKLPYTLSENIGSLRQLIKVIVHNEVEQYNSRVSADRLLPFLTEAEIADKAVVGKVGFGKVYSDQTAESEKAVFSALQGFEDGLFRVFVGEFEVKELDEPLQIHEGDTLTFIRLTFLSGRLW